MKTTSITMAEQPQMPPLKVEPQNKLVEKEVRSIKSKVSAEPQIVVQNESIEAIVE
jgi:hypothetical protein